MGVMTQAAAMLRAEVEDAVIAEVGRIGPSGFSKDAIVRRFVDRGAGRTTLYRWVDACLASGEPGQRLARQVKVAAERRAKRPAKPAEDAAREMAEALPAVITVGDTAGSSAIDVINQIRTCIRTGSGRDAARPRRRWPGAKCEVAPAVDRGATPLPRNRDPAV